MLGSNKRVEKETITVFCILNVNLSLLLLFNPINISASSLVSTGWGASGLGLKFSLILVKIPKKANSNFFPKFSGLSQIFQSIFLWFSNAHTRNDQKIEQIYFRKFLAAARKYKTFFCLRVGLIIKSLNHLINL